MIFEGAETRITINGAENIIMRIDDVLAVDEEPPPLPVFITTPGHNMMVAVDFSGTAVVTDPPAGGATIGTPAPDGAP